MFGNKNVINTPNYDIAHFKSKVASDIPLLKTRDITTLKYVEVEQEEAGSQYWIWIAVAIVAVLLGFVSYKMIMEMEKK